MSKMPQFKNYEPHDENGRDFNHVRAQIRITIYADGAMAVNGHIEDKLAALTMLDAAKQSVQNYHDRKAMQKPGGLILPARDAPKLV